MSRIVPHLWFEHQAGQAAEFYCGLFPDSKITQSVILRDTPSGDSELVSFQLAGQPFMAISAGPLFKFNPSTSFILNFDPSKGRSKEDLEALWEKLRPGGSVLMPLGQYSFSPLFGWIQDKYGLSWQLVLSDPPGEERPFIIPALLFQGEVYGRAEEAQEFYLSIFRDAQRGDLIRYSADMPPEREGAIMYCEFMLEGQWFAAMDSAMEHKFAFNEAISFVVHCDSQQEIDHYWNKLSAYPEAEQCGWLKDKFGLSWQVVPAALYAMMQDPDQGRVARVVQAVLQMRKLELAELQRAYA